MIAHTLRYSPKDGRKWGFGHLSLPFAGLSGWLISRCRRPTTCFRATAVRMFDANCLYEPRQTRAS